MCLHGVDFFESLGVLISNKAGSKGIARNDVSTIYRPMKEHTVSLYPGDPAHVVWDASLLSHFHMPSHRSRFPLQVKQSLTS